MEQTSPSDAKSLSASQNITAFYVTRRFIIMQFSPNLVFDRQGSIEFQNLTQFYISRIFKAQ